MDYRFSVLPMMDLKLFSKSDISQDLSSRYSIVMTRCNAIKCHLSLEQYRMIDRTIERTITR